MHNKMFNILVFHVQNEDFSHLPLLDLAEIDCKIFHLCHCHRGSTALLSDIALALGILGTTAILADPILL